nr:protease-helicase NS3 [Hepacivirus P]
APFSLKTVMTRSELTSLAVCVTGSDRTTKKGSVVIMGTPLKSWMGFAYQGALYTCHHGSRGRHLAMENSSPPVMVCKDRDVVVYPLPPGMVCLKPCNCQADTAYLCTRLGNIVPVLEIDNNWVNTAPLTLREAKGSSGAPVICACGGVKGMFLACRSTRGAVSSIRVAKLDTVAEMNDDRVPVEDEATPPLVPSNGKEIRNLVAPTGSGKTTKIPMHYYNAGYKVLVLNPSVATTLSMGPYMRREYKVNPNIRCGDVNLQKGSRLTYMTYGMFLATGAPVEVDVIICDECHATDATTVLGIGRCLSAFEDSPNGKLLILATATPPGCTMTKHQNITTITLDKEGEIPFHGAKLKLDQLKKGRHLIFQTSKKHCEELAATLVSQGIKAVYYYRGMDISVIPTEGDVVVVATDALMTGYTGNFDSVVDCCLQVEQQLSVTMSPTFEVQLKTSPANVVVRMQRRGRTGRGSPGVYYQVTDQCAISGIVPDATVYECFDSGLAWYGLTTAEVATALDFYKQQPITPSFNCHIMEVQQVFDTLGYVPHADVARMKNRASEFVYLHAAQYSHCRDAKAPGPSDAEVWKGLSGSNKCPLLYVLGPFDESRVEKSPLADRIAACYEEY